MPNKTKRMLHAFTSVCVTFRLTVYMMYKNENLDCDELGNKYILGMQRYQ